MGFEQIEICPICSGKTFRPYLTSTDYTTSGNDFNIVQCTNCSFAITNPRPDKSEIGEYYKSQSYISHTGGSNSLIDRIYLLARSRSLKRKRKLIEKYSNKLSLLDYGCGTGEFLNECIKQGWIGNGIEPSKEARSKAEELNKKPIYSDISQVIENQFNTITLWHVLEHVHELNLTLEKLTQSLAVNGTVFIAVPNPTSWDANKYGKNWAAYDVPRHLWHFSKKNMTQLLSNHSLTVKEVIPMKLDAYYVSLLSEQYKTPNQSKIKRYLLGFINGLISNIKASQKINHSSLIYVAKR